MVSDNVEKMNDSEVPQQQLYYCVATGEIVTLKQLRIRYHEDAPPYKGPYGIVAGGWLWRLVKEESE